MIVVDASAALELLLQGAHARAVASVTLAAGESLAAPHLLDLEVAQVMRRLARSGRIDDPRAAQAFDDLDAMPIIRYDHLPLLRRVWSLRSNVTAYDAAYLVLAEALGARLVTCDAALRRVPGCAAEVICIA